MGVCYVCCPAYAVDGPLRKARIIDSVQPIARALGLELILSPLMDRHMGPGAWLPLAQRRDDLLSALAHEVVWACIGGYGSVHLIPDLLTARPPGKPLIIGYSDITILHACWRKQGWGEGIYSSLPVSLTGRAGETMLALMRGEGYRRDGRIDAGVHGLNAGRASGPCLTVCLSVLAGLCGTPAMPSLQGCVLAIEDVDERPFQLDFAMTQLHLSGALDGVVALVGGSFTHKERSDYEGPTIDEMLGAWAARLKVPGLSRLPFGHIDDGLAMPCGRMVEVACDVDGDWSFTVMPGGVRP